MKRLILAVSVVIGIFIILQVRSFRNVASLAQRSGPRNALYELRTLQLANANLRASTEEKKHELGEISTQLAKETIEKEINSLELLSGEKAVKGEGLEIIFSQPVKAFWLTDMLAQFVFTGAQAVSFNDLRIMDKTAGFRDLINGILMRRFFFQPPFSIKAIGPKTDLRQAVSVKGGILDRMQKAYPQLKMQVLEKDQIVIPAVE